MNIRIPAVILACFVATAPIPAFAAGLCCQLSSGVQESLAGIAAPAQEETTIQINYSVTKMDEFREGSSKRSLDDIKAGSGYTSLPVAMDMVKYTLTAGYGFNPDFKAFLSIPMVRNTMDMTSDAGMMGWMDMTMQPVSGLGDITVMGLYRLSANRAIRPDSALAVGFGLKTASGSATEKKANGQYVHAHMQPGTGSWDPLLSLIYTKMKNPFLFQADVTYQVTTQNREHYEFGDSCAANVNALYAVTTKFNAAVGLTYLWTGKAQDPDNAYNPNPGASLMDDPANTGGNSLWLSPGIQFMPFKQFAFDVKYQLPMWERVNGVQLVSSSRIVAGLSYRF